MQEDYNVRELVMDILLVLHLVRLEGKIYLKFLEQLKLINIFVFGVGRYLNL